MKKVNIRLISFAVLLSLSIFAVLTTTWLRNKAALVENTPVQATVSKDLDFLDVEIADTSNERTLGLSGRSSLRKNSGLLFLFDEPGLHGIWMKDMKFPIDIIWLDRDYVVVDIKKNAKPESYPEVFIPRSRAVMVLEVNAGFVDEHTLLRGEKLELSL